MRKAFLPLTISTCLLILAYLVLGEAALITALIIGGVLAILTPLAVGTLFGMYWTRRMMREGAQLAIDSASHNDAHDARKIQALAQLTREASRPPPRTTTPSPDKYPALPFSAAQFQITGLEEVENEQISER